MQFSEENCERCVLEHPFSSDLLVPYRTGQSQVSLGFEKVDDRRMRAFLDLPERFSEHHWFRESGAPRNEIRFWVEEEEFCGRVAVRIAASTLHDMDTWGGLERQVHLPEDQRRDEFGTRTSMKAMALALGTDISPETDSSSKDSAREVDCSISSMRHGSWFDDSRQGMDGIS